VDWTLEVVLLPVSDIDRSIAFYRDQVGFALDHDTRTEQMHIAQLTPAGSGCSIVVGDLPAQTEMAPGSMRGLQLCVADAAAARQELLGRGVEASEITVFDERDGGTLFGFSDPDGNTWAVQQLEVRATTPLIPGEARGGSGTGLAADLHRYLQQSRDGVLAALEGVSEYDIRRPMTPSATNLLGLVKHLAGVELGYLGDCVGRPSPVRLPWVDDESVWDSADMWATADQTRQEMVDLYRVAWQHSDRSIDQLGLDAPAYVSWWPEARRETTLGSLLVRLVAETAQHAGHADIVRETIDGRAGRDHDEIGDATWWARYVERVQQAADAHRAPGPAARS